MALDVAPARGAGSRRCDRIHPAARNPQRESWGGSGMPDGSCQRTGRSPGVSSGDSREVHSGMYVASGTSVSREEKEPDIRRDRKRFLKLRIERNADAAHLKDVFDQWLNMVQQSVSMWSSNAEDRSLRALMPSSRPRLLREGKCRRICISIVGAADV